MSCFFRMTAEDIAAKTPLTKKYTEFVSSWECTDYTVLRCMQALGGALLRADLIDVRSLELLGKFLYLLISVRLGNFKSSGYLKSRCLNQYLLMSSLLWNFKDSGYLKSRILTNIY